MRYPLPRLDVHATHACNLTCRSCSHFSNHGFPGGLSAEGVIAHLRAWAPRLAPEVLSVLGGEPALAPDLVEIVEAAVDLYDRVEVNSNGLLLGRHLDAGLLTALAKSRRGGLLAVTQHGDDPVYLDLFTPALAAARRACADAGVEFQLWGTSARKPWTLRYAGHGPSVAPLGRGDARSAWTNCWCRSCAQLHGGLLWKCPQVAYLPMVAARWPEVAGRWPAALGYRPLGPGCSDAELAEFLSREEEAACGECPASPPAAEFPSPLVPARELLRAVSAESPVR